MSERTADHWKLVEELVPLSTWELRLDALAPPHPRDGFVASVHPDDRAAVIETLARAFAGPLGATTRFCHRRLDGQGDVRRMETVVRLTADEPHERDERPARMLGVSIERDEQALRENEQTLLELFCDITERQQAEEQLRASLREKEILLREVHHRVKNNLQIVSSLLYLQSAKVGDPVLAGAFRESRDRVASMALVHEMLYRTPDLTRIEFTRYVRELGQSLFRSYGVPCERIGLVVESECVLGIDLAVSCGLLLTEILSNSLKHAYAAGERGTLRVSLEAEGELCCQLRVSDDGRGLPHDFEERRRSSLGTKLIDRLVEQLGGAMVRTSAGRGTHYEISFRPDEAERRSVSSSERPRA